MRTWINADLADLNLASMIFDSTSRNDSQLLSVLSVMRMT